MTLHCQKLKGGVALVILNRPEARNALSADLRDALRTTFVELAEDASVRAVVLTGAGDHFCAGGDVKTMGETDPKAIDARMAAVAETAEVLGGFPKPLAAAVAGHAAGAGVSLACLCDLIVAEESARFTFAFLRVGLGPDWGLSFTLPRRVGPAAAKRLILTRASLNGAEALEMGLADRVTGKGEAREIAIACAADLAAGPSHAMAAVKKLLDDRD